MDHRLSGHLSGRSRRVGYASGLGPAHRMMGPHKEHARLLQFERRQLGPAGDRQCTRGGQEHQAVRERVRVSKAHVITSWYRWRPRGYHEGICASTAPGARAGNGQRGLAKQQSSQSAERLPSGRVEEVCRRRRKRNQVRISDAGKPPIRKAFVLQRMYRSPLLRPRSTCWWQCQSAHVRESRKATQFG